VQVKRTLALGNLLPRIRHLYRDEKIDAATVRHLTLASKVQQRDWLALFDGEDTHAPVGQQLKAWLFGGASIPTSVALFDLATYDGQIVADLFGEDSYFADADRFWTAQCAEIEARAVACREAGWREVIILEPGEHFQSWEQEHRTKKQGGKVYIAIGYRGDVTFHEGFVSHREARKLDQGEAVEKPVRPEITSAIGDYVDLHRHAAVRAELANAPSVALRVAIAHMIVGSPLWTVRIENQGSPNDAVAESVEGSDAEAAFDAKRRAVLAMLDFDAETPTMTRGVDSGLPELFAKLLRLDDRQVLDVLAVVMGETLHARSPIVDALGLHLGVDMSAVWQPDEALLDLIRDREVLTAMVAEVAGDSVANANAKERGKTLKTILRDCFDGASGRAKVEGWVPRWMRFPASAYTARGGVGSVDRTASVETLVASLTDVPAIDVEPEQVPLRHAA
jgi:ParB family chromosome partitioning protein